MSIKEAFAPITATKKNLARYTYLYLVFFGLIDSVHHLLRSDWLFLIQGFNFTTTSLVGLLTYTGFWPRLIVLTLVALSVTFLKFRWIIVGWAGTSVWIGLLLLFFSSDLGDKQGMSFLLWILFSVPTSLIALGGIKCLVVLAHSLYRRFGHFYVIFALFIVALFTTWPYIY